MSMILVVEPDAGFAAHLADSLRAEGWPVAVTEDRGSALARSEAERPRLVLVDAMLPDARDLLHRFSTANGGPGSMALVPAASLGLATADEYRADGLVPKPFSEEDLRARIGAWLARGATPARPTTAGPTPGTGPASKPSSPRPSTPLSSDDIFGDILAEVEADLRSERATRLDDDLERKLEQTLSGVLDPRRAPRPSVRTARGSVAGPPDGRVAGEAKSANAEVDALLESTLGPLARPSFRPASPPRVPPARPAATPATPVAEPAAPRPTAAADVDDLDALATRRLPIFATDPGEPFGDYSLLERIAVGGMAEVWRARRRGVEGFQKTVAIKRILSHLAGVEDFVSMLVEEAKLAAQLSHNNITQIYDLGKVDGDFFIAMEYVDGMDLRSILIGARERDTPLAIGQALSIAAHLARALDHAHRKRDFDGKALNLVHRDISPQNVLISFEGEIKLCDFGIARAVSKVSHTQMGTLKGKLQYMSPEQAWGRKVDARTDIFSLGTVLFEMLTGSRLFSGDSEISILDAVRDCRVPLLRALRSEIPENVEAVVHRALAKNPDERYQTAGDLDRDLAAVLETVRPAPVQADLADFVRSLKHTPVAAAAVAESSHPTGSAPLLVPPPSLDLPPSVASAPPTGRGLEPTPGIPGSGPAATGPDAGAPRPEPAGPAVATPTPTPTPTPAPTPTQRDTAAPPATPAGDRDEEAYELVAAGPDRSAGRRGIRWWLLLVVLALLVAAVFGYLRFFAPSAGGAATVTATPGTPAAEPTGDPADADADADAETASRAEVAGIDDLGEPAEQPTPEAGTESEPPAADGSGTADTGAANADGGATDETTASEEIDIEGLVSAEIEKRAAKLRRDFDRERREIEAALSEAQTQGQEPGEATPADAADEPAEPPPPPPPRSSPPPPSPRSPSDG